MIKDAWNDSGKVYGYRKIHDDLIEMGYAPGPDFKKMLSFAEEAQLEDRIKTSDEARARWSRWVFMLPPLTSARSRIG